MKGVKDAEGATARVGRAMQKIGAVVSVAGAAISVAIQGQLSAADQAGKTASSLGLTVEQLTRFQHAAAMSGVEAAGLETAFKRLSVNMLENADRFGALGIAVENADGTMRSADQVMSDLADVLAAMPDGAEKTALAMELMGKSGADLIPMLNGGRDALREMLDEADALGLTISGETAQAAAQFNDNIARLAGTVKGWVVIITAELAPALARITDAVVAASEVFRGMSPIMRQVAAGIAAITVVAGPVLLVLGTLLVSAKAIIAPFVGIAGLLAGAVKAAFVGLAVVIGAVGLPITLLVAGVAALTAAVVTFWPEIMRAKDAFVEFANQGIEYAKTKLQELIDFALGLGKRMYDAGANIMSGLRDGITEGASRAWSGIKGTFDRVIDYLPGRAEIQSPSRLFARFGQFIMQGLGAGLQDNAHTPIAAMEGVAGQLTGPIDSALQSLQSSAQSAFTGFVTGAKTARQALSELLSSFAQTLANRAFSSLFGSMFSGGGFLGSLFGGFRANGGPVTGGKSYIVGERGPELFTPTGSGSITPNHAMGGAQQITLRLITDAGVTVQQVGQIATGVAVQVVREGLGQNRKALPNQIDTLSARGV
jgi:hypothetical protein